MPPRNDANSGQKQLLLTAEKQTRHLCFAPKTIVFNKDAVISSANRAARVSHSRKQPSLKEVSEQKQIKTIHKSEIRRERPEIVRPALGDHRPGNNQEELPMANHLAIKLHQPKAKLELKTAIGETSKADCQADKMDFQATVENDYGSQQTSQESP